MSIPLTFGDMSFAYSEKAEGVAQTHEPVATSTVQNFVLSEERDLRSGTGQARQPSVARQHSEHPDAASNIDTSMNSRMENMVDGLMRPEPLQSVRNSLNMAPGPPTPTFKTPLEQDLANTGISQSQPATFTARDIVQRIQHSSSASQPSPGDQPINVATLPSIFSTPFTPRPGETPGSSPRPQSAHRFAHPVSAPTHPTSSVEFQANLMHMQDQIQMRTSPQSSFQPTMSNHYDNPTNMTSWMHANDQMHPQSSPWRTSFSSAVPVQQTLISTRPLDSSPYGAIGESRPRSSRIPNSGQNG